MFSSLYSETVAVCKNNSVIAFSVSCRVDSTHNVFQVRKYFSGHPSKLGIVFNGHNFHSLSEKFNKLETFEEFNNESTIGLNKKVNGNWVSFEIFQTKLGVTSTLYMNHAGNVEMLASLLSAFHFVHSRARITQSSLVLANTFVKCMGNDELSLIVIRNYAHALEEEGRLQSRADLFLQNLQECNLYLSQDSINKIEEQVIRMAKVFHIKLPHVENELKYLATSEDTRLDLGPDNVMFNIVRLCVFFNT